MEFKTTWEYCFICCNIVEHLNGQALSHTPKGKMYGVSEMALHEPVCKAIDKEEEEIYRYYFEVWSFNQLKNTVDIFFKKVVKDGPKAPNNNMDKFLTGVYKVM